jgi:uncharacterized protein YecE (DUF72 family)
MRAPGLYGMDPWPGTCRASVACRAPPPGPEPRAHPRPLAGAFRASPLVLDVRHQSCDRSAAYEWAQALGLAFCTIDQHPVSYAIGVPQVVTRPTGSRRRHGRKAAAGFAEDSDAAARDDDRYRHEERTALVAVAEAISRRARDTSLITNHHVRGHAALNALELRHHCAAP